MEYVNLSLAGYKMHRVWYELTREEEARKLREQEQKNGGQII